MPRRRSTLACCVLRASLLVLTVDGALRAQEAATTAGPKVFAEGLYDARLGDLRKASATWEFRSGPIRRVADVVCLVPDVPTLLEAIATWDEQHYFPILLEDAEYTLKFLRAFGPARVVRFPRQVEPIPDGQLWEAALDSVGRSWVVEGEEPPPGDAVPALSRRTPPGIVLSEPSSPSMAGAVALAAGRFQPLLRWEIEKGTDDVLSTPEAEALANELIRKVAAVAPNFAGLGDGCDFLTLAGAWPYRYDLRLPDAANLQDRIPFSLQGRAALDDLLGRGEASRRWAYVGRLVGDERASLYRAMCALFLPPDSAVLFDTYDQDKPPWTEYDMTAASQRLSRAGVEVTLVSGTDQADAAGWHRTFDPVNRARLVMINSAGNPRDFRLTGGRRGAPDDVPPTDPAAVLMIHSFSATDPADPDTVAGRWLANGAFLYYGSLNEPGLQAFRPATLVADLIAEYLPFSAAVRQIEGEPFAFPWRLHYLGDPLYRLRPPERRLERIAWEVLADWPSYTVPEIPRGPEVGEAAKLAWTLKAALVAAAQGPDAPPDGVIAGAVLAIRRDGLSEPHRAVFDALAADVLLPHDDRGRWRGIYSGLADDERPAGVDRLLRTTLVGDLHAALASGSTRQAGALWAELMGTDASEALKRDLTRETGRAFEARGPLGDWQRQLGSALRADPTSEMIRDEFQRIRDTVPQPARR